MTVVGEALGALQRMGGEALRQRISGDAELPATELVSRADLGLFGPQSTVWRVHGDAAMLIGGIRSLLFQALHPLAMAGVDQHSNYREDPWGRLNRTGRFVGATTFGSTAAADQQIEMVKRVHRHVRGFDSKGRPYSASDPHLLNWVHVIETDSFLDAFNRYGQGKLTDAEKDSYVAEMAQVALRLGAKGVPRSVLELNECLQGFRLEMEASPAAHQTVRFLLAPPDLPLVGRIPYAVLFAAAAASLPGYAQRMLRLPILPLAEPFAVRPAALVLTRGLGWFMAGSERSGVLEDRLHA